MRSVPKPNKSQQQFSPILSFLDKESSLSTDMDSRTSQLKQQTDLASRKRKVVERSVVRVKMEENCRRVKNEGPPSDSWSWRKYGQKPIKGSPFPRGYYRCSTSKGCSAKKQVERCRTDASVLVITYTSTHNHPTHDHHNSKQNHDHKSPKQKDTDDQEEEEDEEIIKKEDQDEATRSEASTSNEVREEQYFQYIESPLSSSQDMMMNQEMMMISTSLEFVLDEKPINMISCCSLEMRSPKSEEGNDFFDELEELPAALPLITSFTRSNCFQETIPPLQS